VGGERASPFIINTPFLLTTEELCKRAADKNIDFGTICDDSDDKDEGKTTAAPQSQQKLKDSPSKPADAAPVPEEKTSSSSAPKVETQDEKKIKDARELLERLRFDRKLQKESAQIRNLQSSEVPQRKNIIALLLRCLIPMIAGGIVAVIYRANLTIEAGIGAALAVVLLFWPVAYLWDDLEIGDEWKDKQTLFAILYFCYATLFYFLAKLGSQLGYLYLGLRRGQAIALDYKRMIESFIPALIAGTFVQLIVFFLLK
ncbi:MAG: hypothetical protein WA214_24800, partial [Pseudolabrys sp.]